MGSVYVCVCVRGGGVNVMLLTKYPAEQWKSLYVNIGKLHLSISLSRTLKASHAASAESDGVARGDGVCGRASVEGIIFNFRCY